MKHYLLFISVLLCLAANAVAQEQIVSTNTGALDVQAMYNHKSPSKSVNYYYRHHKVLPTHYSGYLIEIKKSDLPLRRDHQLFKQFGSIYYDRLPKGGYSYGIKVAFTTRYQMKKYLKEVVQPKASEAKIVKYKDGKRRTKV